MDLFSEPLEMPVKALAPWFGAKRAMAAKIIDVIGQHTAYWEPFCGSMAVLMSKPRCVHEVVNDLHQDLVNLARVMQNDKLGPQLYRRLRRVWFSQAEFFASRAIVRDEVRRLPSPDLDRAYHYFVRSWMGTNGVAGTSGRHDGFCRRFSSNGGSGSTRWSSAVASIPAFRRRLRGVDILDSCGIDLCSKIEDKLGTVIYVDPPYLVKGAKYEHDFENEDHSELAGRLRRFERTRVVVSYYADPLLSVLYPGWRQIECPMPKFMGRKKTDDKAPEVLLVNWS